MHLLNAQEWTKQHSICTPRFVTYLRQKWFAAGWVWTEVFLGWVRNSPVVQRWAGLCQCASLARMMHQKFPVPTYVSACTNTYTAVYCACVWPFFWAILGFAVPCNVTRGQLCCANMGVTHSKNDLLGYQVPTNVFEVVRDRAWTCDWHSQRRFTNPQCLATKEKNDHSG